MESPVREEAGAPGQSATYHYPNQQKMSLKQELKSKGRDWKCPVSECYKWPWDISCKCQGVWLYLQARTHCDAFLSHEILFLKNWPCTLRLRRINTICGRQIYLYLQEVLSSWILDHFWLSVAPFFCSAVQGLQRALSHSKTQVAISSHLLWPSDTSCSQIHYSLKSDFFWLSVGR